MITVIKQRIQTYLTINTYLLLGIFIIGFIIRVYNLPDNIIFAYDQARDAQRIVGMLTTHDIKIVGPETDIAGIFNSPFLYYLLLPIYLLFNNDPNIAAIFFVIINLLMIFVLYHTSIVLFNRRRVGLLAAILWVIPYEFFTFSKFISNASLMIIGSIIFFAGLAIYIFRKKNYGLTISIVGLAFAVNSNIYLIYLILLYPFYYFIFNPKINVKMIFLNGVLLGVLLSTFIISEVKWGFTGVKSLLTYTHGQSIMDVSERFAKFSQKMSEFLYFSFFSFNNFLALSLFIGIVVFVLKVEKRKQQLIFLLIWVFSTLPLFAFSSGVLNVHVVNTTIFGAVTILFALAIHHFLSFKRYNVVGILLLLSIILGNFMLYAKDDFKGVLMLGGRPFLLQDEKKAIDFTYKSSAGKDFSVCAVTAPLFINTLWSYLYSWYGKSTYGYLPYWSGQEQVQNANLIPYATKRYETRYLIIQPDAPAFAIETTIFLEDEISTIEEVKKFGEIIVQKRKRKTDDIFIDSQGLNPHELANIKGNISIDPRYFCDVVSKKP